MSKRRSENYITEYIFVPLYNRSRAFRKLISEKFGCITDELDGFGKIMYCTCDDILKKKNKNNEYGNPDAKTNLGNYVEVKTRSNTSLTNYETDTGDENGNGYKKYINDKGKLLLYVLPDNYKDERKIVKAKNKVGIIRWSQILKFLKDSNINDPFIQTILANVDNIDDNDDEIRTFDQYSARIFNLCMCINQEDNNFKPNFEKSCIKYFPYGGEDEWN